jgi:HSP20 family protein
MSLTIKLGGRLVRSVSGAWKGLTGSRRLVRIPGDATRPEVDAAKQKERPGALDKQQCQRPAECWETARAIVVKIEIPRTSIGDLAVLVHPGTLRVRAEKRSMGKHRGRFWLLIQRALSRLDRSIPLPVNIDPMQAEISYQDGVLTVIVPKTEATPPARLPIP